MRGTLGTPSMRERGFNARQQRVDCVVIFSGGHALAQLLQLRELRLASVHGAAAGVKLCRPDAAVFFKERHHACIARSKPIAC